MKKTILCYLLFVALQNNGQNINTIAGTGVAGYSGDGGAATSANLKGPNAVAIDAAGNVYIADMANNRIRKINTSGTISTFAGTGIAGYSGDGAAANLAQLNGPFSLTLDASGNIYIADTGNGVIRKVSTSGTITTVAGSGVSGFSGDGALATLAQLNGPKGVAVDGLGNIYIADYNNNRIRKVSNTGTISTIAGTTTAGSSGDGSSAVNALLNGPSSVALDGSGNLYIADYSNARIRMINTSGIISTYAGNGVAGFSGDNGVATSAQINFPTGVTVGAMGNIFIADYNNHRIRKVNSTGTITTVVGVGTSGFSGDGGSALSAQLSNPSGVGFDLLGDMYIADQSNERIRKVTSSTDIKSNGSLTGNFLIFPNPNNGLFHVDNLENKAQIEVSDVTGRVIFNRELEKEKNEINLTSFENGVYFYKITGEKNYSGKFIKQ